MEDNIYSGEYTIGDVLWAKIGNHPFWPCMVSYHPLEGRYWKIKKVRNQEIKIFHVQYFGTKVLHGWVMSESTFLFRGETHYYNSKVYASERYDDYKLYKSTRARYNIPTAVLPEWKVAVDEAEIAMLYKCPERYEKFVFKYENCEKSALPNGTTLKTHRKRKKESKKQPLARIASDVDEKLCRICEKGNIDLNCAGTCLQSFHKQCLGLINAPKKFKCPECDKGLVSCFACKKADFSVYFTKCNNCDYHYHDECMQKFECANFKKRICPLHVCSTCQVENQRNTSSKGSFIQCFRCPTVFHATTKCIPAGSVLLTPTLLLCPYHFFGKKKVSPHPVSNVLYCVLCFDGGELICCEACPNAYHRQCLNRDVPEDDFFCDNCLKRKYMYIGMVVWAKTGNFRWWPAQIIDPKDISVPDNIKKMKTYDGEFLIKYFGTSEYCWTHRGRVFPYIEEHKDHSFKPDKQNKLTLNFKLGIIEAAVAYDDYVAEKKKSMMSPSKPDTYKHIKVNHAVPPAQITVHGVESVYPCTCNKNKPNPCSSSSFCINRSLAMECHPDNCPAGELCENQRFQKRQYASVKVIKTEKRGWGLQSNQFIPKGSFVIEYVGEVITHKEHHERRSQMRELNIQNYYFLYLDSRRMIDAGPKGNLARFINHSCNPNCIMEKWHVNGDLRIGIFSLVDIQLGEELTFNYHSEQIRFDQKCYCGSENCQGFIGRNGEKQNGKKNKIQKLSK